jgi:hypothetical protein
MPATSLRDWKRFEGVHLAGEYNLQEWLGESDKAAFFRAFYGEDTKPVLLKLIPAETVEPAAQLELWNRIGQLSHPHLLRLLDFRRTEDPGSLFLYAVFEFPEEMLGTALEKAPLTEAEASEVREAVADALRYIHSQGFVHGAVDAGNIVAVGNQIKLASDTLCEASDSRTPAQDIRQLEKLLPEPAAAPPPPLPVRASSVPRRSFPAWASAAIVVILGIVGYAFLPRLDQPPPAKRTNSQTPTPPQPVPQPPATSPAPAPEVSKPKPMPAPTRAASTDPENWRVIAFTYFSRQVAERKAESINQKWPEAKAEVFLPSSGRSAYLVAVGGWLNRDDAVRLLKIARGKGLPRDIYIQNYTH